MNRNKELAKNTMILTLGKICTQFLNFFLLPLYTTVLKADEYGVADLFVTYTSLLMPIVLFQVDQALFRFLIDVRQNNNGKKGVFTTAMVFALIQGSIFIIFFSVIQIFIPNPYKWYLLFNVLAALVSNMMLQCARGIGDNISYTMASVASATTQIICNVIFLVILKLGVYGMLTAIIVGQVVCALLIFVRCRVYKMFSLSQFSRNQLKKILLYSIPLIPNALCWWIINASDRTIVLIFLGATANGILAVGHKFSTVFITFYNIFNLSWTESAALHMNDPDREEFFSGVITNMFKLFMCVAIGIIACMPFVFPILINKNYSTAFGLIPVFMLASMLNVVVGLYSVIYVALKKTNEIAKTAVYSGIINVSIALLLVKFIGIYAAAVSSVLAFGSMAIYRYCDLKKYLNIRLDRRWIFLVAFMYIGVCISYYIGTMLVQGFVLFIIALITVTVNWPMLKKAIDILKKKFHISNI